MLSLKTYYLAGGVIFVVALLFSVYFKGRHDGAAGPKAQLAELAAAAREQEIKSREVSRQLEESLRVMRKNLQSREVELAKVVRHRRYLSECLDDDGLSIAQDALTNGFQKPPR